MSTLSSVPSARSLLSPKSNGHISAGQLQNTPGISSASFPGTYQKSLASAKLPNDGLNLSPDELFTRHTVLEVRAVQHRLRADADAKQEELRLMVGERYRDLLQASSSIISIASSSQRVLDALEESREAIISQHALPVPPKTAAIDGLDDRHLYTLQVLSAHMKLLLDAPEHLWRLIERKKYFQAAWLFLLARVVHRALLRNDDNDEQSWVGEGVDVLVEFPLVQRQWDVVSQFRSQIIHKSTLSLREASASTEDTCATLVTLHLLDSRPLNDTLAALFLQRSKTLQSLLSWNLSSDGSGHAPNLSPVPVREVTQVMKNALSTISQTVCTARTIFHHEASGTSLMTRVLESIQADYSESDVQTIGLPDELSLSTKTLLTQLTSSANFQLLPPNLRSYKPYIDLDSSSTSLPQSEFSQKLQEWFRHSSKQWHQSAEDWFSGLQSVKDVWSLRGSIRRCIMGSRLEETERSHVTSSLDSLCHKRIITIWQRALLDAENNCKTRLRENVFSLQSEGPTADISPVDFLFQPPSIPILSQTVKSFVDTPFQKYQISLKKQLVGRSAQLDNVISTLEQCAKVIQLDFAHLKSGGDGKSTPILQRLKETYEPTAIALSTKVVSFVDEVAMEAIGSPASVTIGLAFLSRVTADLAYSSPFVQNIGCSHESAQEFKRNMLFINEKVIRKWRETTIDHILQECRPGLQKQQTLAGPSPQILQALLTLCESIRQLGIFHQPVRQNSIAQELLRSLVTSWFGQNHEDGGQSLHDLAFLQKLSDQYGQSWAETSNLLAGRLKASVRDDAMLSDLEKTASDYLARTQTLLSGLLPPPSTLALDAPLLQFGNPSAGPSHIPAIDLAKPSPRFGMLLVGNADR